MGFVPARHAGENTRLTIDPIDMLNSTNSESRCSESVWSVELALYVCSIISVWFLRPFYFCPPSSLFQPLIPGSIVFLSLADLPDVQRHRAGLSTVTFTFYPMLRTLSSCYPCSSRHLGGVPIYQREYKLSLFADDILLTLTPPHIFPPSLHALYTQFGSLSDYKINTSKMEALPLHIPSDVLATLRQTFPYRWCPHPLKYLGVQIKTIYSSLYLANYTPLLRNISDMLKL